MKLYIENKQRMNEEYEGEYICDVTFSDPKKQELARYFNDLVYRALDNCYISAASEISNLPDLDTEMTGKSERAIANLVKALVDEFYGE